MAHLIDKDALVSEIERLTDKVCDRLFTEASVGAIILSKEILSFLDTLEVKEVEEDPYVMGKQASLQQQLNNKERKIV